MQSADRIVELERSHDELRGALVKAGLYIRKFQHVPDNARLVDILRRVLLNARDVRRKHEGNSKVTSEKAVEDVYREKRELEKKNAFEKLKNAVAEFEWRHPKHWQQVNLHRALQAFRRGCYAEGTGDAALVFAPEEIQSEWSPVHNKDVKPWNKEEFLKELEAVYAAPAVPQFKNAL